MPVTHYYIIGKLSVSSSWIALIVAFVIAYSAVRVRYGKKHAEILSDAFFYLIIVWKLSVLITDFSSVIRSPMSLIYFDGGVVGFYLGLVFIAGKLLLDRKKGRLAGDGLCALFTGAVIVQAVYQVMMVFLNDGELFAQVGTVITFALFVLFYWLKSDGSIQFIGLFVAVHVFVASLQPAGLVGTPFVTTLLIGCFFAVVLVLDRRNSRE
jgi:hypothetical protein